MNLDAARLVVTGGGSGIGRAVALGAAHAGARVMITGRRLDALQETQGLVNGTPGRIDAVAGDVTTTESVRSVMESSMDVLGSLDGVVNAAGIVRMARSEDVTDDDFLDVLETNLVGAFRVSREAARFMLPNGHGSIVHPVRIESVETYTVGAGIRCL